MEWPVRAYGRRSLIGSAAPDRVYELESAGWPRRPGRLIRATTGVGIFEFRGNDGVADDRVHSGRWLREMTERLGDMMHDAGNRRRPRRVSTDRCAVRFPAGASAPPSGAKRQARSKSWPALHCALTEISYVLPVPDRGGR